MADVFEEMLPLTFVSSWRKLWLNVERCIEICTESCVDKQYGGLNKNKTHEDNSLLNYFHQLPEYSTLEKEDIDIERRR